MLTQIGSYNTFPIMAIIGNCKAGFGDTTAMETIENQNKQISELQEELTKANEMLNTYTNTIVGYKDSLVECKDELHRRNLQIAELKKRVAELEAYNMTFGDKRDV